MPVGMDLQRIAWLVTVVLCVLGGVILLVSGYQGYAALSAAVGLSAAINLIHPRQRGGHGS
jgi:hypothetical protein